MSNLASILSSIPMPVAPLKIIALEGCKELGIQINNYIVNIRKEQAKHIPSSYTGYTCDNYLVDAKCFRFGSGEGKAFLNESIRGSDLMILVDVCNHSITYNISNKETCMSPDDHMQDLKRIISAANGKAHRITVIMPFLYEGRQNKRSHRESLDCANALQELDKMGISSIITFDAHDPRVQNAIPIKGFDNFFTTYQFIKSVTQNIKDISINSDHLMIVSPDEGGMSRAVYYANILGVDMGMCYKRKDYSRIINGQHPLVAHEFLGSSMMGKDILLVDDMIATGKSVLEVAKALKRRHAKRIFILSTFGLFTKGFVEFDKGYQEGLFNGLFITNLSYIKPELIEKDYYINVNISSYLGRIIDGQNHDISMDKFMNPTEKIRELLDSM